MKLNKTLTALVASAGLGLAGQAMAAGTAAGTPISNQVFLNYQVSGANQQQLESTANFVVDQRVDMTLVNNSVGTAIAPGATETYTLRLENTGNKEQVFKLAIDNTTASTDSNITIPAVTYAIQTQHNLTSSISGDEITVPADGDVTYTATLTFPLQNNTPANIVNAETFDFLATATAVDGTGTALSGDNDANKNANNTSLTTEMIVLAEAATTDSIALNGEISALVTTTISTASLENGSGGAGPGIAVKVVNDPICEAAVSYTDYSAGTCPSGVPATYLPKAIPGAMVEYTITTNNASTTVAADHLQFTHTLPATEASLGNVVVTVNSVNITNNPDYTNALGTFTIQDSSTTELRVNIEQLPATQTATITFTAIVQ